MAWFLELSHHGVNQYPRLRQILDEHPELYPKNKVRVEMFRRTGYFVTESSEHFAEYTPYFMRNSQEIERLNIPVDEYLRRCQNQQQHFEETRALLESGGTLPFVRSHEYASYIIHSHQTGFDRVFYGNVANTGLVPNLPPDSCVEVACVVNRSGVQPCYAGPLPTHLAALDRTNINVQQVTVDAALTGKREHIYHAAMLDPNTAASLTLDQIWHLVDDLIDAHGKMLPKLT
jgi:alpha-galactosidase